MGSTVLLIEIMPLGQVYDKNCYYRRYNHKLNHEPGSSTFEIAVRQASRENGSEEEDPNFFQISQFQL